MSHALVQPLAANRIYAETAADAEGVEALVLAAFGPGRFAKTAERLREGSTPSAGFVARQDGRVIGGAVIVLDAVITRDGDLLNGMGELSIEADGGELTIDLDPRQVGLEHQPPLGQ